MSLVITHIYSSVLVLNVLQVAVAMFLLSRVLVKLGTSDSDLCSLRSIVDLRGDAVLLQFRHV